MGADPKNVIYFYHEGREDKSNYPATDYTLRKTVILVLLSL